MSATVGGLRVVRGPDWKWQDQDGGEGHVGTVVDVGPVSTATVLWDGGGVNRYRIGEEGAYDLRVFDSAPCDGNVAFAQGEQVTSSAQESQHAELQKGPGGSRMSEGSRLSVGKKVRVTADRRLAKMLQKGHGGWVSDMKMALGKVGKIKKFDDDGDVRVKVDGHTWVFNPECLESVASNSDSENATSSSYDTDSDTDDTDWSSSSDSDTGVSLSQKLSRVLQVAASNALGGLRTQSGFRFEKGDVVTITKDLSQAKQLQTGHGEWVSSMKAILGQIGKVKLVYFDGDLRVKVCGREWTLNPACCSLAGNVEREAMSADDSDSSSESSEDEEEEEEETDEGESCEASSSEEEEEEEDGEQEPERLSAILGGTSSCGGGIMSSSGVGDGARLNNVREDATLATAIALDDASAVRDILSRSKGQANSCVIGKRPLMMAAHQSNMEIARMLLEAGADVNCTDDDGNSALHYAAAGRKPDVLKLLLDSGAPLGAANKRGRTLLHIASANQEADVAFVRLLLERGCDPNAQDTDGDTPLLRAIDEGHRTVTAALIDHPASNINVKNHQGHNALHRAIVHGDHEAAMAIIRKQPAIIDERTNSGLTVLHLSAVYGQKAILEMVLKESKATIEQLTEHQETPLLLAVAHCQAEVADMLLECGASVFARDERGDTCLHMAIAKHQLLYGSSGSTPAAVRSLELIGKLLEKGADPTSKNIQGISAEDLAFGRRICTLLQQHSRRNARLSFNLCQPAYIPTHAAQPTGRLSAR